MLLKALYSYGARGGNLLLLKEEASYNSLSRPMNSWLKPYEQSPRQGVGFSDFGRLSSGPSDYMIHSSAAEKWGCTPVRGVTKLRE